MCMVSDLLNLVDARVTLTDHPLNYLIRNAFHCKFSEQRNQLKKHIGTEGMQYRLVSHTMHFILFLNQLKIGY